MLVKFDPFREVDRLADQAWGPRRVPRSPVPIDVHRIGNEFVALLDLPGVKPGHDQITVDKHDLTVTAERQQLQIRGRRDPDQRAPDRPFRPPGSTWAIGSTSSTSTPSTRTAY